MCFRKTEERRKKKVKIFKNFLSSYLGITVIIYSRNLIFQQHAGNFMVNKCSKF